MKKLIGISILLLMIGCMIGCKTENVYPVQVVTKSVKCDSTSHHDNDSSDHNHDGDERHGK